MFAKNNVVIKRDMPGKMSMTDGNLVALAGLKGFGLFQTSSIQVGNMVRSGELVQLLPDWSAPAPPVKLLYFKNRFMAAVVRAFVEFMCDMFPPDIELL